MNDKEYRNSVFSEILSCDDICILSHRSPDGDTLGSTFALCKVLRNLQKNVCVACSDEIPNRLRFITDGKSELKPDFEPKVYIAVDIASESLLGEKYSYLAGKIDYSIDHHYSNTMFAKKTILFPNLSAAGEALYILFKNAGIQLDDYTAEKLYTAISSDTACFRYSSTTSETLMAAADLLKYKFDFSSINVKLFETASLAQLRIENEAVSSVRQYRNNQIAMVTVRYSQIKKLGVNENELDGLTAITRRVEGTIVGITVRERSDGEIKISLRSQQEAPQPDFDVSAVAAKFGGGGHVRAAGLSMRCSVEEAEKLILEAVFEEWDKYYDNSGK